MANSAGNVSIQPYFLKTPDFYAVGQERMAHNEAVYAYGEYSMFALLWNALDYAAGIVDHCPQCYNQQDAISRTYNQPSYALCDYCYGTTFYLLSATTLGGLKARIVRPALWNPSDETQKLTASGIADSSVTSVQSISDFRMRTGDIIMKADATRWRVAAPSSDLLISGFQASDDARAMIGYNYGQCVRQDDAMPCFLIPPLITDSPNVTSLLDTSVIPNYPVDFSAWDVINGPLIGNDLAD